MRSGWSARQLDRQIGSQFYERVALSKNKAAMMQKAESLETDESKPEQAIRDPFVLEFLDLKDESRLVDELTRTQREWEHRQRPLS